MMTTEIFFHQTDIAWWIEQAVPIATALIAVAVAYLGFNHALRNVAKDHQHQFQIRTYENLLGPIRQAIADLSNYNALLHSFASTVAENYQLQQNNKRPIEWHYRPKDFIENYQRCAASITTLSHAIEAIRIVEPKFQIFSTALSSVHWDITDLNNSLAEAHIAYSTKEMMLNGAIIKVAPDPIMESEKNRIQNTVRHIGEKVIEGICYIEDLKVELQNLLLGEIYNKTKLPHRVSTNPKKKVVSVDKYDDLVKHFKENTQMGIELERSKNRANEKRNID